MQRLTEQFVTDISKGNIYPANPLTALDTSNWRALNASTFCSAHILAKNPCFEPILAQTHATFNATLRSDKNKTEDVLWLQSRTYHTLYVVVVLGASSSLVHGGKGAGISCDFVDVIVVVSDGRDAKPAIRNERDGALCCCCK